MPRNQDRDADPWHVKLASDLQKSVQLATWAGLTELSNHYGTDSYSASLLGAPADQSQILGKKNHVQRRWTMNPNDECQLDVRCTGRSGHKRHRLPRTG